MPARNINTHDLHHHNNNNKQHVNDNPNIKNYNTIII